MTAHESKAIIDAATQALISPRQREVLLYLLLIARGYSSTPERRELLEVLSISESTVKAFRSWLKPHPWARVVDGRPVSYDWRPEYTRLGAENHTMPPAPPINWTKHTEVVATAYAEAMEAAGYMAAPSGWSDCIALLRHTYGLRGHRSISRWLRADATPEAVAAWVATQIRWTVASYAAAKLAGAAKRAAVGGRGESKRIPTLKALCAPEEDGAHGAFFRQVQLRMQEEVDRERAKAAPSGATYEADDWIEGGA